MKRPDILLRNAVVVTIDNDFNIFEPGAVVVSEGLIIAVGTEEDILLHYKELESIDCKGNVLMPGFVNSHTHLPMAIFRGLMDDLRLSQWLNDYIFPTEEQFVNSERVKLGTQLACAELIQSGCTTVCDMYYHTDTVAETLLQIGLRGICNRTITSFPGVDNVPVDDKFKEAEMLAEKYKNSELITLSIAPHAPYTNTEESLKRSISFAKKHNKTINMHFAETADEAKDLRNKYGSLTNYLEKLGFFDVKCNFAHCIHLNSEDIKTFRKYNIGVAHNPSSNMKLASGAAPITEMINLGINVGIGTDGNSSNNDLDFIDEMRTASFLAKIQVNSPTALTAKEIIYMGTLGGAKSLFLDKSIGSLEVGKSGDLIIIDINTLHNIPRFKHNKEGIYGQIVYAAKSTDVTHVMVQGRWLMRDRKLQSIELPPLLVEVQKLAVKIDSFVSKLKK